MTGTTAVAHGSPPRDYLIPPRPARLRPRRPLRRRHTTRPTARPLPTSHLPPHQRRPRRPRRRDPPLQRVFLRNDGLAFIIQDTRWTRRFAPRLHRSRLPVVVL